MRHNKHAQHASASTGWTVKLALACRWRGRYADKNDDGDPTNMNIRYLLVSAIVLMVNACVSTTEIVPAGKDTYVVAGTNDLSSGSSVKTDLYRKADAYCETLAKKLLPLDESVTPNSAELRFRCLDEHDPEYARPTMESVPDIKIETK